MSRNATTSPSEHQLYEFVKSVSHSTAAALDTMKDVVAYREEFGHCPSYKMVANMARIHNIWAIKRDYSEYYETAH